MKSNIFSDIKTAVKLTGEISKARKSGADSVKVEVKPMRTLPTFTIGPAFLDTPEGSCLWNCGQDIYRPARDIYRALPYETRREIACGNVTAARARFWQTELRNAMPPEDYHRAMLAILSHLRKVRKRQIERETELA